MTARSVGSLKETVIIDNTMIERNPRGFSHSKFIELTQFWYNYVSLDHHKDRDCHFYINQVFSYGEEPYWRIEHYGYITELPKSLEEMEFTKHEHALSMLYDWLLDQAKEVINFYKDYEGINEDYNWQGARDVANKYKHILNYGEIQD